MQNLRKGDIVTIQAVVTTLFRPELVETDYFYSKIAIKPTGHHDSIYVNIENVELHTPFFNRGDQVTTPDSSFAEVVGTFDDFTWVRNGNGAFETYIARDLRHREVSDVVPD